MCRDCGKTFAEQKLVGIRIHTEKQRAIVVMCKAGASLREIGKAAGVHINTVRRTLAQFGLQVARSRNVRKPSARDRAAYLKQYSKIMNDYQRNRRNEMVRTHIQLWLAKQDKPQTAQQIFDSMRVTWPHLKIYAVKNMLNRNCEGTFKAVGRGYVYTPSPFWIPVLTHGKPNRFPDRNVANTARAIWFQRHGLTDHMTENAIARLKQEHEEHTRNRIADAMDISRSTFQLMATAAAITNHE